MLKNNYTFFRFFDFPGGFTTLKNKSIRWSHSSNFNDPFDCNLNAFRPFDPSALTENDILKIIASYPETKALLPTHKAKGISSEIRLFISEEMKKLPFHANEFHKKSKEIVDGFLILCLSRELENILMWGHYTKGHTGMVIEFVAQDDNIFCAAQEVKYQDNIPNLLGTIDDFLDFAKQGDTKESREKIFETYALRKSTHWSYEKEWRIACPFPEANGSLVHETNFNSSHIKAIYLGCKTPPNRVIEIKELAKREFTTASVYKAVISKEKFELNFTKI